MPFKYYSPVDRLIANSVYDPISNCWTWLRAVNNVGRPTITVRENGRVHKILVTRFIAQFVKGEKLPRKRRRVERHTCHDSMCVNPDHHLSGTYRQNNIDTIKVGNRSRSDEMRAYYL